MRDLKTPYENDPAALVAQAFDELFPGIKYAALLAPDIRDEKNEIAVSCITFPDEDDGPDAIPVILINSQAGVEVAAEALAEQLVHAALGIESLKGGPEVEAAMKKLIDKYNEIAADSFPETPTEGGGGDA